MFEPNFQQNLIELLLKYPPKLRRFASQSSFCTSELGAVRLGKAPLVKLPTSYSALDTGLNADDAK